MASYLQNERGTTLKASVLIGLVLCAVTIAPCSLAYALDETAITPTAGTSVSQDEQEFNDAMGVWLKHDYQKGEKMLREFSKKHPDSRWAAEADLHVGCNLAYQKKFSEAKPIFEKLIAKHPDNNIALKAYIRLGNIGEQTGDLTGAIKAYSQVIAGGATASQFKYANYRVGKLMRFRTQRQALIRCAPVALASCLEALGKQEEAAKARELDPGENGLSLAALQSEAQALGIKAIPVQMSLNDLKAAKLPVLAFLKPNHFMAVLSLDKDKARVEDSIEGKHDLTLKELEDRWDGKVLVFDTSTDLQPLAIADAEKAVGGCCGLPAGDECSAWDTCPCAQGGEGPGAPGGKGNGPGPGRGGPGPGDGRGGPGCTYCTDPGRGRPTWKVNTVNLNLMVRDTPIWYNPGRGPEIAFTLTYSNDSSDTGIFGPGWRSPYDTKVYFLPSSYANHVSLQIHRDSGRIETYEWNGTQYVPREGFANWGYRDKVDKLETAGVARDGTTVLPIGTVVLTLQGGGAYYFKPEGGSDEGRIWMIEDQVGQHIACGYTSGKLTSVTDANGTATEVTPTGDTEERVATITLPDTREASFNYDGPDLDLVSITDMANVQSTLEYDAIVYDDPQAPVATYTYMDVDATHPADGGALIVFNARGFPRAGAIVVSDSPTNKEIMSYTSRSVNEFAGITRGSSPITADSGADVNLPFTTLNQAVTTTIPAGDGSETLTVASTEGFPYHGSIRVNNEIMSYTGKTPYTFGGITRDAPGEASIGDPVALLVTVPFISKIVTPAGTVEFSYKWYGTGLGLLEPVWLALRAAYEYGPVRTTKPSTPTWYFDTSWWSLMEGHYVQVTHYPESILDGQPVGGLTKRYWPGSELSEDAIIKITEVTDTEDNQIMRYVYDQNGYRDRISAFDGNNNETRKSVV